jgi:hypothetical protein
MNVLHVIYAGPELLLLKTWEALVEVETDARPRLFLELTELLDPPSFR